MPYWRTFYHLVWTTKNRVPLITPELEAVIFPSIVNKVCELGAISYALNGTMDHIHLIAAIPPRLSVAKFVGEIKGRASYHANHRNPPPDPLLDWQTGYGVLTFGEKNLTWVMDYVLRQKEHHAIQTTLTRLETCLEDEDGPPPIIPDQGH